MEGVFTPCVRAQPLNILQQEEGGSPAPPAPAHSLSLFPDGPDLIMRMAAGHRPDDDPGQALAPGRLALDIGEGTIPREVAGSEGCVPGRHDRGFSFQAPEEAFVHDGQALVLQYPGNLAIRGLGGCSGVRAPAGLRHQEGLTLPGGAPMQRNQFPAITDGTEPRLLRLPGLRRQSQVLNQCRSRLYRFSARECRGILATWRLLRYLSPAN